MLAEAPIRLFVMGANRWRDEQDWPLKRAVTTPFYLHTGGGLSTDAPDTEPLDINRLASISPEDQRHIRLIAEPSIKLLYLAYPADAIWRTILAGDDAELAAIDPASGHVHLLIERRATGVEVERLQAEPWQFLKRLCGGEPLAAAIDPNSEFGFASALAEHFSLGRFASFELIPSQAEDQG